jgi:hypothetical protein
MIDEELAGQDSRMDRVRDKERRNKKVSQQGYTPITLALGQKVMLQDQKTKLWEIPGVIESIRPGSRSAYVHTEQGVYLRNRRYIKVDPSYQEEYSEAVNGVRVSVSMEKGTRHHSLWRRLLCLKAKVPAADKARVTFRLYCCDREHRDRSCSGVTVYPGDCLDSTTVPCQCGE